MIDEHASALAPAPRLSGASLVTAISPVGSKAIDAVGFATTDVRKQGSMSDMREHGGSLAQHRSERWIREDEAARVQHMAPNVAGLRFEFHESPGEGRVPDSTRFQHILVPRAAALQVGCSDAGCRDGGFDITAEVLRALRERKSDVSGESCCFGSVGDRPCERVLKFRAVAEWGQDRQERSRDACLR